MLYRFKKIMQYSLYCYRHIYKEGIGGLGCWSIGEKEGNGVLGHWGVGGKTYDNQSFSPITPLLHHPNACF